MKISWCIFIISGHLVMILSAENLQDFFDTVKPYGSVVFADDSNNQTLTIENLMKYNPALIEDLNEVLDFKVNSGSFKPSIFQGSQRSSVYIIIPSSSAKLTDVFKNIVKISPVSLKPKILLFISNNFLDGGLKSILLNARSLKFLDFTIIQINTEDNYIFLSDASLIQK